MAWIEFKAELINLFGISRDAMHILSGVGLQALLVLAFRSWFGAVWPVGVVALLALGNEWIDVTEEIWPGDARGQQWLESAKDMTTTLLVPVLLLLLSRFMPDLLRRPEPVALSEGPAPDAAEIASPPDAL